MTNEETFTITLTIKDKEVITKCLAFIHQFIFVDGPGSQSHELQRIIKQITQHVDEESIVAVQNKIREKENQMWKKANK